MRALPDFFLTLLDQNIPLHLVVDSSNTIVRVGPAIAQLLAEDIKGRYLLDVFSLGELASSDAPTLEVTRSSTMLLANGGSVAFEGFLWAMTGGGIWLLSPSMSTSSSDLNSQDFPRVPPGASQFLQAQFQKLLMLELSEVASLERQQRLRADALVKDMSLVAAMTSHDICNYMQVLSGHLDELLKSAPWSSNSSLQQAREASELATMLLHSMMSIAGHDRAVQIEFLLDPTISEVRHLFRSLVPEHVAFDCNLACPGVSIFGERGGFIASLLNLVKNASEAIGKGQGKITITTQSLGTTPGRILITVDDTGSGWTKSPSQENEFFTTKRNGTGLGLVSVKSFCHRSGWTMQIVPNPGRGTRAELIAPVSNNAR